LSVNPTFLDHQLQTTKALRTTTATTTTITAAMTAGMNFLQTKTMV